MTEESLTELLHNLLALLATICFAIGARRHAAAKGYLILGATLFALMFLRELDFVFDLIFHGAWIYPALVVLAVGVFLARRAPGTVRTPGLIHLATRHGAYIFVGLAFLLFFTRLFGTGDLWEAVMRDAYRNEIKAAIQEGLELMSYFLIAFGAVMSLMSGFGNKPIAR